jgi:hypothetical protein
MQIVSKVVGCCLMATLRLVAQHPDLTGKWVLSQSLNNVGSFKGPTNATDSIIQTDTDMTINRTRGGEATTIHLYLNGAPIAQVDGSVIRSHWDSGTLIIDFTASVGGSTTNIEEQVSLRRNGGILYIYRKGPQGARLSLFMTKQ